MAQNSVSIATDLRLIPVGKILDFSRVGVRISFHYWGDPVLPGCIPGSLIITSGGEQIRKKEISWEIPNPGAEIMEELEWRRAQEFVATYTDQWGKRRICGVPEHPVVLNYAPAGDAVKVTLTAESIHSDLYL